MRTIRIKFGGLFKPLHHFLRAGAECAEGWGPAVAQQWMYYLASAATCHDAVIEAKMLWMVGERAIQQRNQLEALMEASGLPGRRQMWWGAMMALLSNVNISQDKVNVEAYARVADAVLEEEAKRGTFGADVDARDKVYEAYLDLARQLKAVVPAALIPELDKLKENICKHRNLTPEMAKFKEAMAKVDKDHGGQL